MAESESYADNEPFWTDGTFQVFERSEGHYTASRVNGSVYFRGSLESCANWIAKERKLKP